MSTISNRIERLYSAKGLTLNAFAKQIGVSQATIDSMKKRGSEPNSKTIISILESYKDISAEWLLRGEGSMYKQDHTASINVDASSHVIKNNTAPVAAGSNATATDNSDMASVIAKLQETIAKQQETIAKLVEKL